MFYRKLKCYIYQKSQLQQLYDYRLCDVGFIFSVVKSYIHIFFPPKVESCKPDSDLLFFLLATKLEKVSCCANHLL